MRLATLRCWALLLDGALGNAVWAAPAAPDCSSATPSEAGNKTERLYQQGECALLRRQYRTATESFSELVARDPNPVWRAELGRAYLGAQQFERAREQFLLALQSDPPQAAKKLLHVFLQLADQQQTQARDWFATASVGLLADSNVNSGPRSAALTLFGLPFTLGADALAHSDRGLHASLSVVQNKALSGLYS